MTIKSLKEIKTTADITVPDKIIDQVIGQEKAIEIIKIAAKERRNVLLLGNPGTGKSMLGKAYAELMPKEPRPDILVYPNYDNPNSPEIIEVEAGLGEPIVEEFKKIYAKETYRQKVKQRIPSLLIGLIYLVYVFISAKFEITSFLFAVLVIISLEMIFSFQKKTDERLLVPNLIIKEEEYQDNDENTADTKESLDKEQNNHNNSDATDDEDFSIRSSPISSRFIDATGVEVGRLLGDVKHDPYESGGLGTPPHERVMPGAIHLANKGVLFIDEIGTLSYDEQISLLTAMQERRYSITGRSTGSSSSLVQTAPIPCDFALVAAGNYETAELLHPAFRSRFLGYGYEVKMNDSMADTAENRLKIAQFIAQEITKDKKLLHFNSGAINEIISIAKELSPKSHSLTLSLRKLGGYVRAASDISKSKNKRLVEKVDVEEAFLMLKPIEAQEFTIEIEALKGNHLAGAIYVPSDKESSTAIGSIKIALSEDKDQRNYMIIGREEDQYISSQIKVVQTMLNKYFREDLLSQKQLIVQFEGITKTMKEGLGLPLFVSALSALNKIKIEKSTTAIGDVDILGNIVSVPYFNIRRSNAKKIGLTKIYCFSVEEDHYNNEERLVHCDTIDDLLKELKLH